MQPGEKLEESSTTKWLGNLLQPSVSDLGEDSHIPGTPKSSITAGVMATENPDPDSQPQLWNHFRHTVQLLTLGSQAWSDGSRLPFSSNGARKPKLRPFPATLIWKVWARSGKDIHGHFYRRDFYAKVSWDLPSLHFLQTGLLARLLLRVSSVWTPLGAHDPCAPSLAAHLLFTVLPLLSQSPLPPKVSQNSVFTLMTKTQQVTEQEERYQGQTAKGVRDRAITLTPTSTHTATTGTRAFLGCRKPALLDQPRTEEACAPPNTRRPPWWCPGVCALGPSISVAVLQTTQSAKGD